MMTHNNLSKKNLIPIITVIILSAFLPDEGASVSLVYGDKCASKSVNHMLRKCLFVATNFFFSLSPTSGMNALTRRNMRHQKSIRITASTALVGHPFCVSCCDRVYPSECHAAFIIIAGILLRFLHENMVQISWLKWRPFDVELSARTAWLAGEQRN